MGKERRKDPFPVNPDHITQVQFVKGASKEALKHNNVSISISKHRFRAKYWSLNVNSAPPQFGRDPDLAPKLTIQAQQPPYVNYH